MIKRGFSLVEMAIVLLIIGILFSIVTKGKNLMETASFRKDMSKINNLVLIWLSIADIEDRIPRYSETSKKYDFKTDFFYSNNLLDESDFYIRKGQTLLKYGLHSIAKSGAFSQSSADIAAAKEPMLHTISVTTFSKSTKPVSYNYYCMMENVLDDSNSITGKLRVSQDKFSDLGPDILCDCNQIPKNAVTEYKPILTIY